MKRKKRVITPEQKVIILSEFFHLDKTWYTTKISKIEKNDELRR